MEQASSVNPVATPSALGGRGEGMGVIKMITWHHQTQVKSPGRAKKLLNPRKDPLVPTPNQY
jgi:hypothetical protein